MSKNNGSRFIAIGSTNSIKTQAVQTAFEGSCFQSVKVSSSINEQPIGLRETRRGAENRLRETIQAVPQANLWIVIENGLKQKNGQWVDFAVVILYSAQQKVVVKSEEVLVPTWLVDLARERGFSHTTVGKIIAELYPTVDSHDPHNFLTNGQISRLSILVNTLLLGKQKLYL